MGRQSFKSSVVNGASNDVTVSSLMSECTSMLREKMWNDTHSRPAPAAIRYRESSGAQPESAMDAMGPVLETVLSNMTTHYESLLIAKDAEMKTLHDELRKIKDQNAAFEQQLAQGSSVPQIEYQPTEEERAEMERLKNMELALTQQVCTARFGCCAMLHCTHRIWCFSPSTACCACTISIHIEVAVMRSVTGRIDM